MRHSRRRFLAGAAAVSAGALGGCLGAVTGGGTTETRDDDVQASFFVVADFAEKIADGVRPVETLVPFGQHGHGWEPGPDVQRRVFDASAFVYVGEGFQPWADDLVANVQADGAGVTVIEARRGIDLLDPADDHRPDEDGGSEDHDETHEAADEHDTDEAEHDEAADEAEHDEAEHDEAHTDHAGADPHFWLDPSRATQAVENIAAGLRELDDANATTYTENATAFTDRLAALDATYEERLASRTRDTVLVAGHDSFQYLARRYGFVVEALTGIAPDAEPTPQDIRRAQRLVDEHDIEYVLAPVFESDRAAQLLVRETSAVEVLPLTPVPTLTDEWVDRGWGYVDVMERVNLPSLVKALGAE